MILSKKFECTNDDLDSVIVSVAKKIEDVYIDCNGRCLNCDYDEVLETVSENKNDLRNNKARMIEFLSRGMIE